MGKKRKKGSRKPTLAEEIQKAVYGRKLRKDEYVDLTGKIRRIKKKKGGGFSL